MSSQSGIAVSSELIQSFPDFVASNDVAAVLAIDHAKEHVALERRVSGSLDDVRSYLENNNEAKYIALRLANEEALAFVQYMPDMAPLSSKMKYASSHATIHRQLGGSSTFKTTIFWTELEEVSDKGLERHKAHEEAPSPLTEEEQSLVTAKELETARGSRGSSVAGQSTLAIHANVSTKTKDALSEAFKHEDTATILKVSSDESESIDVVSVVSVAELAGNFQDLVEPRYVVVNLNSKIVFAFVCPRKASIKQRMLIASTRISFLEYLKTLGSVDAQVETFDPESDLTVKNIMAEIEPLSKEGNTIGRESLLGSSKPKFQRPRPPKRR